MARVVAISLVATDRMSRTFDDSAKKVKNLNDHLDKLSKVGKITSIAVAAGAAAALTKAVLPATAAVAAMPTAFINAKVAIGVFKVGIQGVGDAMKAVATGDAKKMNAALKNLAPNAKAFVIEMAKLQKSFKPVQQATQNRLFANLSGDMAKLGKGAMPVLHKGMVEVAGAMNGLGREAVRVANTPWFKGAVAAVLKWTAQGIQTLTGAVRPLAMLLSNVALAGAPMLDQFTRWAVDGLNAASAFFEFGNGMSRIYTMTTKAAGVLTQLGHIGFNLVTTIINLTKNASLFTGSGDDMLTVLDKVTQKMAEWSGSADAQQRSAETFKLLGDVARQVVQVLPILGGALKLITGLITSLPGPVRTLVVQMLAWSVTIGFIGSKLKILTLAFAGLKVAGGAFKAVNAGIKGIQAAPATFGRLSTAIKDQLTLWKFQAQYAMASAKAALANAANWTKAKAVMAGNWLMNAASQAKAFAAAQLASARATLASMAATVRQKVATIASTVASVAMRAATIAWTAVQWLLNAALTANPIGLVVAAIALLIGALVLAYKKSDTFRAIVNAAWAGIKLAISSAWNFIKPIFMAIAKFLVTVLGTALKWYWAYVKFTFTTVWKAISAAWSLIRPVFNLIKSWLVTTLRNSFVALRTTASQVWGVLRSVILGAWNNAIKPAFNWIKAGVGAVKSAFSSAVSGIKTVWDRLRGYTKAPISFFVNTVYMGGVRRVWEGVRKLVPALPDLPAVKFATGGVLPGYAPGRDSVLAMLSPGEGILRPEATRALGESFITRANKAAKSGGVGAVQRAVGGFGDPGGMGIPGFADGGIVGILKKAGNWVSNAGGSLMTKGVDWFAKHILDPIRAHIPGGSGMWAQAMTSLPKQMIDGFLNWIHKTISPNWGGGGSSKAVQAVRSRIGTPYSWGGGGPYGPSRGIGRGANTVGFDCSSLMQYGWYQAAHKVMPRTTYTQRPWLRQISKPVPGAVGQPHPGHTYMYSGNGKIIEAPFTGGFVREVPMRSTPFWGLPPWKMDGGGNIPPNSMSLIHNGTSRGEMVMTGSQQDLVRAAIENGGGQNINLTVNLPVGVDPMKAGQQIADILREYRRRGGKNPYA